MSEDEQKKGGLGARVASYDKAASTGEIGSVDRMIASSDYALYTRGNGLIAPVQSVAPVASAMPAAPARPVSSSAIAPTRPYAPMSIGFSNYRSLRDTDNRYYVTGGGWIDWSADRIPTNDSDWLRLA